VALASAGPHANHLHLAPDTQPRQCLITQFFLQADALPDGQEHSLHVVDDGTETAQVTPLRRTLASSP